MTEPTALLCLRASVSDKDPNCVNTWFDWANLIMPLPTPAVIRNIACGPNDTYADQYKYLFLFLFQCLSAENLKLLK